MQLASRFGHVNQIRRDRPLTGCITLQTAPVSEAGSAMQMRTTWTRPFRC